ncbi:MAG: sodium:solute symporter [Chitinophagaceae bacterium]|nr:sodium:solute symporter [Chitinophagaceae bacterium]
MSFIDWLVLSFTMLLVVLYGVYKGRSTKDIDGYFRSGRQLPWYMVMLSVIGTQASAVTFLSGPGQAYTDGMRFVQYYFGLPLATIVLCITFVPIFHKLNIYTAYEYLEKRFDKKTRTFTSFLFLLSRALSTGISVYAPAIILSSVLDWNIYLTNVIMGGIVIVYSVSGGARAVAYTQQLQLAIIFAGLFLAAYLLIQMMPEGMGLTEALAVGDEFGKMNVITTGMTENGFNWNDRFNIISGIIGGFFLSLSYFGTDQSQVGRYLTARSIKQSRIGLIMNGIVKIPMQFFILLVGVLVFVYYAYNTSPLYFNDLAITKLKKTAYREQIIQLEEAHQSISDQKKLIVQNVKAHHDENITSLKKLQFEDEKLRTKLKSLIKESGILVETNDTNYVFIRFVMDHMPHGLIGLLIAVIFLAAWGSIAASLNALSSSTLIDFHKQFIKADTTDEEEFRLSKMYTLFWGIFCIVFAQFATNLGSLIEAVNILGSWFYGVMLGIFLVAFYLKKVGGNAVFYAAILGELSVLAMYAFTDIGWLWLNVIGALAVVMLSLVLQLVTTRR